MTQLLRTSRTAPLIALGVAAAAVLAGCSSPAVDDAQTAAPRPVPSETATPDPYPTPDGSEQLVRPVDDIGEWAASVVPTTGDPGYVYGLSGWLSQQTSPTYTSYNETGEAGAYRLTLVCEGESTLQVTVASLDDEVLGASTASCATSSTTVIDFATPTAGYATTLQLDADPVTYAVAVQAGA